MSRYIQKNLIKKIFLNQLTLTLIGIVIIIMIAVPLGRNINKQYRLNKEINEIEDELARLTQKNKSYSELIKFLQSDQFIEKEAKQNLNFRKEGESVAVIKDENTNEKTDDKENLVDYDLRGEDYIPPEATNPSKWFNYFFD